MRRCVTKQILAALTLAAAVLPCSARQDTTVAVADTASAKTVKTEKKQKEKKPKKKVKDTAVKQNKERTVVYGRRGRRDDPDAAAKAMAVIIKKYQAEHSDTVVGALCDGFKNDPKVCTAVADAYFYTQGDTAKAIKYLNRSLTSDSHYAPAYVLRGDILAWAKDTVRAGEWYDRAIAAAPASPKGYEAVARINRLTNPAAAEAAYDHAKQNIPGYPATLMKARMYDKRAGLIQEGKLRDEVVGRSITNVVQFYDKAWRDSTECDSLDAYDYSSFSSWLYASGKADKSMYLRGYEVAEAGMKRFPDDIYIMRMYVSNGVMCRKYKPVQVCAERIVTSGDSTVNRQDFRDLARVYMGQSMYDKAIAAFNNLLARQDATDDDRSYAIGQIAAAYAELGEYDKADNAYRDYIAGRESAGTITFYDMWTYAEMYLERAEEANGQDKVALYMKADEIYGKAAKLDLNQADIAYYRQFYIRINDAVDPGFKQGKAVEPAQQVVAVLESRADLPENKRNMLKTVCNFLGTYYLNVNENRAKCRYYFEKVYDLDPQNNNARQVLTKIFKMSLPD